MAGDADGDNTDPAWIIEDAVLAKAPAAFRFGTSKKRRRSGAAGGRTTQKHDDLPLPVFGGRAAAIEAASAMMAATREDKPAEEK